MFLAPYVLFNIFFLRVNRGMTNDVLRNHNHIKLVLVMKSEITAARFIKRLLSVWWDTYVIVYVITQLCIVI